MSDDGTIKARFNAEMQAAHGVLNRARSCAALTKPWVLPPLNQRADQELPENYQSIGSRGTMTLTGKLLSALFPPGAWFGHELAPEIKYDQRVPEETKQALERALFMRDLKVHAIIESGPQQKTHRRPAGFRSQKRQALDQLNVTGDVLERLHDDFRLQVFRRDQYVTQRDTAGDVIHHITVEKKDPRGLTEEQRAAVGRIDETIDPSAPFDPEKLTELYTLVEWQPQSRTWVIRQEIEGKHVAESEETVSPYFATSAELVSGENYGRGIAELNHGSLRSLNEMEKRRLDILGLMASGKVCRDYNSLVRDEDLEKPAGSVIEGKVTGGKVQDLALLSFDGVRDVQMLSVGIQDTTRQLGTAYLLESEVQPEGERVTRYQVQRVAAEVDGALGGLYAPIAEQQQIPLINRVLYVLKRDNVLNDIGGTRLTLLTGMAALMRNVEAQNLLSFGQIMAQLGPEALRRIDMGVLIELVARIHRLYEPGLIKSDEQLAQEQATAAQQALAMQAGEKAIDTVGNAAEERLRLTG